jgi:hypothetical protein
MIDGISMTDKELAERIASEYQGPLSVTFWVAFSDRSAKPTVLRTGNGQHEDVEYNVSVLSTAGIVKSVRLGVGRVWVLTMARGTDGRWVSF